MNKYGLTKREKEIWPPKHETDAGFELAFFLILLTVLATLFNFMILNPWWKTRILPPNTQQMSLMTDREQETLNCKIALSGFPTDGATLDTLKNHCKNYD